MSSAPSNPLSRCPTSSPSPRAHTGGGGGASVLHRTHRDVQAPWPAMSCWTVPAPHIPYPGPVPSMVVLVPLHVLRPVHPLPIAARTVAHVVIPAIRATRSTVGAFQRNRRRSSPTHPLPWALHGARGGGGGGGGRGGGGGGRGGGGGGRGGGGGDADPWETPAGKPTDGPA